MSLLSLVPVEAWGLLGAAVMAVLTVLGIRRGGAKTERAKQAERDLRSVQRGQKGAQKARDELAGGKSPQDVVNRNSGKW